MPLCGTVRFPFFLNPLSRASVLRPPLEIAVQNDNPQLFKCTHDITQVLPYCAACIKNYTCILLFHMIIKLFNFQHYQQLCPQLLSPEKLLEMLLLGPEPSIISGLANHSCPEPPPVPQHSQWLWDLGTWTDPPIFARNRKKLVRALRISGLWSGEGTSRAEGAKPLPGVM